MPDTPRLSWTPGQLLPWWGVITGVIGLVMFIGIQYAYLQNLGAKLGSLEVSMNSGLAGIRAETSAIPRVVADVVNLERRVSASEKIDETRDDRIGRMADSIGILRSELQEVRADLRYYTGQRATPAPTARAPR